MIFLCHMGVTIYEEFWIKGDMVYSSVGHLAVDLLQAPR